MSLFIPIPGIAATPLPTGFDDASIVLRRFILNARDSVKANEVARFRMLKDAIHSLVADAFQDQLDSMIEVCALDLYEKLKADPAEEWPEQEADDGEGLPLDLPGRDNE